MLPYGPNWFAAVMGTAIVSVAVMSSPTELPGRSAVGIAFWALSAVVLAAVTVVAVRHWRLWRAHLQDPVMAHFYGAPAMALMATGAATMLAGSAVIGEQAALAADVVLWSLGTAIGLLTAVVVPYLAITRYEYADDSASGAWLMPVVPPMVTAATGALLVPHVAAGQPRELLLLFCYACFGAALLASLLVTGTLWQRLVRHGVGAPATVPTVWIVLGFLGQSVTAAHHLGTVAPGVLAVDGGAFRALTLVYGVPVWGFAMLWLALATALVVRQARRGMPFAMTWWSFTFPLGTVVTGTEALASATGLDALQVIAGVLLLALVGAWATVATRTIAAFRVARPAVAAVAAPLSRGVRPCNAVSAPVTRCPPL